LADGRGRVFVDLWDIEPCFPCDRCRTPRIERLRRMNLSQTQLPPVNCQECTR
jgi:archaeosine synthase beta-subunit